MIIVAQGYLVAFLPSHFRDFVEDLATAIGEPVAPFCLFAERCGLVGSDLPGLIGTLELSTSRHVRASFGHIRNLLDCQ